MADDFGVSRTTVRWALTKLTEEMLLGPVIGRTRLVADPGTRTTLARKAAYLFSRMADVNGCHNVGWAGQVQSGRSGSGTTSDVMSSYLLARSMRRDRRVSARTTGWRRPGGADVRQFFVSLR